MDNTKLVRKHRRYNTKKRVAQKKNKQAKWFMLLIVVLIAAGNVWAAGKDFEVVTPEVYAYQPQDEVLVYQIKSETIREITAYNVGDVNQTDATPCIGAYTKVNLCEEVAKGTNVCAANFVPLGTELLLEAPNGWTFQCIVWDRMNSRHAQRVDVAMNYWEKDRAVAFGLQRLNVKVLEKQ